MVLRPAGAVLDAPFTSLAAAAAHHPLSRRLPKALLEWALVRFPDRWRSDARLEGALHASLSCCLAGKPPSPSPPSPSPPSPSSSSPPQNVRFLVNGFLRDKIENERSRRDTTAISIVRTLRFFLDVPKKGVVFW